MKNLWKVEFDAKYTNVKDLMDEEAKVVANGDGMSAIKKARKEVIGRTFEDWRGPDGFQKEVVCRCVRVKLTGLTLLHSIDA